MEDVSIYICTTIYRLLKEQDVIITPPDCPIVIHPLSPWPTENRPGSLHMHPACFRIRTFDLVDDFSSMYIRTATRGNLTGFIPSIGLLTSDTSNVPLGKGLTKFIPCCHLAEVHKKSLRMIYLLAAYNYMTCKMVGGYIYIQS